MISNDPWTAILCRRNQETRGGDGEEEKGVGWSPTQVVLLAELRTAESEPEMDAVIPGESHVFRPYLRVC